MSHEDMFEDTDRSRGSRGRRKMRHGRGPGHHRRHGGGRMRRGAAAKSALLLLAERSMHGYEIIAELEERTEGRWRPSPGSMYPSLSRLEEKGLISGTTGEDGKREYELTEAGREFLAKQDPDAPLPWDEADGPGGGGDLRAAAAELLGQTRQIGRFGSPEQRLAAVEILTQARKDLYAVLAD